MQRKWVINKELKRLKKNQLTHRNKVSEDPELKRLTEKLRETEKELVEARRAIEDSLATESQLKNELTDFVSTRNTLNELQGREREIGNLLEKNSNELHQTKTELRKKIEELETNQSKLSQSEDSRAQLLKQIQTLEDCVTFLKVEIEERKRLEEEAKQEGLKQVQKQVAILADTKEALAIEKKSLNEAQYLVKELINELQQQNLSLKSEISRLNTIREKEINEINEIKNLTLITTQSNQTNENLNISKNEYNELAKTLDLITNEKKYLRKRNREKTRKRKR